MIIKVTGAKPIKEMVIRFSVALYELQGNLEVVHSEYDLAVDVQPHVQIDPNDKLPDGRSRININGDALFQEIISSVGAMQYTAMVANMMRNRIWTVVTEEEEKKTEGDVEILQDEMTKLAGNK